MALLPILCYPDPRLHKVAKPVSHDHLFHSMLSLSQVSTRLAKPELDLFAACSAGR